MINLQQRKTIYRARRGLKELDIYFDPYVKQYYLTASPNEQQLFEQLIEYEDPDLLDWFMNDEKIPSDEMKILIQKLKMYVHA
ncbi:succinate dehydrogenase assembly factor 2 [Acinetobacter sp. B5B]|uniref:FAD assembly factor SdhE n=1 Tax=Acinetobacter baretiae TaxID=2605383 RepID=UPI0018C1E5DF|nr:succinate dehydrogenase assembly factor 2 [Acinetobacter baretiae]MBF7683968.1 succinate dehydrogenase assembly factor 2 [Acinetobacter baretiae]